MRISIDLARFIGAEKLTYNGREGIFIPFTPNCVVKKGRRGFLALSSIHFHTSVTRKTFDMKGRLSVPREYLDLCISDPRLIKRKDTIAWLWAGDNTSSGGYVSSRDFDNIIGDDD